MGRGKMDAVAIYGKFDPICTTFLALALGPLVQFQKTFLWTIYLLWRGKGPNCSLLGPILWEELRCKGILDHIFGPSSGTLGPIPKKNSYGQSTYYGRL